MKLNFLIALSLFIALNCFSQKSQLFQKIEKGDLFSSEKDLMLWLDLSSKDTVRFVEALKYSPVDSLSEDKLLSALPLIKKLADAKSRPAVKAEAVKFFLVTAKSRYSSVVAKSFRLLQSIPAKNFDKSAVDSIAVMISKSPRNYSDAILLAGYLNEPIFIDVIKRVFPNSRGFTRQEQWATYKVLARLGDKEALAYCVKKVTALPVNDQVVDVLFPDLIYTRQKEAVDVLIKVLNSDEKLCSSTNPNSDGKILCGYRIMEMLAPVIENFPVKTLPSGDLDVNDYTKALFEVRDWFQKSNFKYIIVK